MFVFTREAIDRQNAAAAEKASRAAGEEIAHGHQLGAGPYGPPELDCQPVRVAPSWQAGVLGDGPGADAVRDHRPRAYGVPATTLTQTGASAPPGSSLHSTASGQAVVQHLDASTAASPGMAAQLGPKAPSGVPGQPPVHTAPSGYGQQFHQNSPRVHNAALYSPGPGGAV